MSGGDSFLMLLGVGFSHCWWPQVRQHFRAAVPRKMYVSVERSSWASCLACRCFPDLSWRSGWPTAPTSPRFLSPSSICVFCLVSLSHIQMPRLGASSPMAGFTCFSRESGRVLRSMTSQSRKTINTTIIHQGKSQILTQVGIAES